MIKAVRGAISVDCNTHLSMEQAVAQLMQTIQNTNNIDEGRIVSLIFSQTDDLNVANPAAALRKTGSFSSIPLFCTKEPDYEGSIPSMLRVLVTYDCETGRKPTPVYLGEAVRLRKDLGKSDG